MRMQEQEEVVLAVGARPNNPENVTLTFISFLHWFEVVLVLVLLFYFIFFYLSFRRWKGRTFLSTWHGFRHSFGRDGRPGKKSQIWLLWTGQMAAKFNQILVTSVRQSDIIGTQKAQIFQLTCSCKILRSLSLCFLWKTYLLFFVSILFLFCLLIPYRLPLHSHNTCLK